MAHKEKKDKKKHKAKKAERKDKGKVARKMKKADAKAKAKKAGKPRKPDIKAMLAEMRCTCCGKHCPLSKPKCGKGRALAKKTTEKLA